MQRRHILLVVTVNGKKFVLGPHSKEGVRLVTGVLRRHHAALRGE